MMPDEAEVLQHAMSIDITALIISLVIIIAAFVSVYGLMRKFQNILGIETKGMREKRITKETIQTLCKDIDDLKKYRKEDRKVSEEFNTRLMSLQDEITNSLHKLSKSIAKKDIDDMRWSILDFANGIRMGITYDMESYAHILDIYDEYENLLSENGMENGRVTMAMKLINEKYEVGMRDGFPV